MSRMLQVFYAFLLGVFAPALAWAQEGVRPYGEGYGVERGWGWGWGWFWALAAIALVVALFAWGRGRGGRRGGSVAP